MSSILTRGKSFSPVPSKPKWCLPQQWKFLDQDRVPNYRPGNSDFGQIWLISFLDFPLKPCPVWGSNSRPSDYETDALPTALTRLMILRKRDGGRLEQLRFWHGPIWNALMAKKMRNSSKIAADIFPSHNLAKIKYFFINFVFTLFLKTLPCERIELTTFRLWDWRITYCSNKANECEESTVNWLD